MDADLAVAALCWMKTQLLAEGVPLQLELQAMASLPLELELCRCLECGVASPGAQLPPLPLQQRQQQLLQPLLRSGMLAQQGSAWVPCVLAPTPSVGASKHACPPLSTTALPHHA